MAVWTLYLAEVGGVDMTALAASGMQDSTLIQVGG